MSNVKIVPIADSYLLNCKMLSNDVAQLRARTARMWACADTQGQQDSLEYLEDLLADLHNEIAIQINRYST